MASKGAIFIFDRTNSVLSNLTSISIKEQFSGCTLSEKFVKNIKKALMRNIKNGVMTIFFYHIETNPEGLVVYFLTTLTLGLGIKT